jgi:hypothetical protein
VSSGALLDPSGTWAQSSGQLVLTAASGFSACEVTFALTNPDSAQVPPAVSVWAEIEDGSGNSVGSIAYSEMTKPGGALFG